MSSSQRFRVNQPAVIAEVIDDEAIIVNLESGAYYSLRNTGCTAWNMLAQGLAVSEVSAVLAGHYAATAVEIEVAIQDLVAELEREALIIAMDHDAGQLVAPPVQSANGSRLPFQRPTLEKYTDMADLLLLDPIHDVAEAGWPQPAPANAAG